MNDMNEFDHRLKEYSVHMQQTRYPHSDTDLDREVRQVMWNIKRKAIPSREKTVHPWKRWAIPAAAACLAAVLIPLGLQTPSTGSITKVDVGGESVYFACNSGCSPDATIETFKTLIK